MARFLHLRVSGLFAALLRPIVLITAILLVVLCLPTRTYRLPSLSPSAPPFLTVFLIDGLSRTGALSLFCTAPDAPPVFERLLRAGELPHISELISSGAYVRRGVTCLPSMTGYCYYPLLTGLEATRSGIVGMRWFDRAMEHGNFINYFGGRTGRFLAGHLGHPNSLNLYEAAASGGWTAAVSANYRRGANVSTADSFAMGLAKVKHNWWVSRWILSLPILRHWFAPSFAKAENSNFKIVAAQLVGKPKVHWVVFGSTDSCMHVRGLGTEYEDALRNIDTLIGKYRQLSDQMGTEAERSYAVLTDHGAVNVSHNLDLCAVLAQAGLRAYQGKSQASDATLSRPLAELADTDACVLINGDTMAHIYFRHPTSGGAEGWHKRVDSELLSRFPVMSRQGPLHVDAVSMLLGTAGVELVVTWDGQWREAVVCHSRGGVARISLNATGAVAYTLETEEDPLDYLACAAAPLVGRSADKTRRFHTSAVWLQQTAECEFPYAPVRLYQLMSAPQGSDIVVTAASGYDFGKDFERFIGSFRGGHGGARADQLSVPYVISGPQVRPGVTLSAARAEDIGATLLHLLTGGAASPVRPPAVEGDPLNGGAIDAQMWRGEVLQQTFRRAKA